MDAPSLLRPLLVAAALLATPSVARAGTPKCNQATNTALATKAFTRAIKDPKDPIRKAYERFLETHKDGIESRYSSLVPTGIQARAFYRKPVENRWVQVIATGTSPGHEGSGKDDATPTCIDQYLAIISVPIEWKWHGERVYFATSVQVINGAKGTTTRLAVLEVSEPAAK